MQIIGSFKRSHVPTNGLLKHEQNHKRRYFYLLSLITINDWSSINHINFFINLREYDNAFLSRQSLNISSAKIRGLTASSKCSILYQVK
ncbi:hypothetical protein SAMN04487897_11720 [Paenibacillus sp. yr247]|nr:hypothetical protein SAMN04487897_11720 [Paenibacillus sp. yr247]